MRIESGWVLGLSCALLLSSAPARAQSTEPVGDGDMGTIRVQIASHLGSAGFDSYFPFYERETRDIAKHLRVRLVDRPAVRDGVVRQEVQWRIIPPAGTKLPRLAGTATTWAYPPGARPAYVPRVDAGDVMVTRANARSWDVAARPVVLARRPGETDRDFEKRRVRAFLRKNGFETLMRRKGFDLTALSLLRKGEAFVWRAGRRATPGGATGHAFTGETDGRRGLTVHRGRRTEPTFEPASPRAARFLMGPGMDAPQRHARAERAQGSPARSQFR